AKTTDAGNFLIGPTSSGTWSFTNDKNDIKITDIEQYGVPPLCNPFRNKNVELKIIRMTNPAMTLEGTINGMHYEFRYFNHRH
ncbi:MAG: hypothetical protein IAF38_09535, partial [Bacteroidia bacterium]|nr:hypothetical protein [Bacteroidia bacterium]